MTCDEAPQIEMGYINSLNDSGPWNVGEKIEFACYHCRSRRFQGFQYRLRYRYQKKGLDDSDTDIDTRDGQNSIPIPILIPRLCKCYKVKYEEMSQFIEWVTQK